MESKCITLPRTALQADKLAGSLAHEATEREFALAALIYAQVLPKGKRKDDAADWDSPIQRVTSKQFADRKIRGLTYSGTVAKYRHAWQRLVDAGHAVPVHLGDTVELPELDWSDWYPGDPRDGTPERHIGKATLDKMTMAEIKERYKADAKFRRAVNKAHQELAEERAAARAAAGIEAEEDESIFEDALALADAAVEEGGRRDDLKAILAAAIQVRSDIACWVQEYGHTGVPDEVDWIRQASAELTEAQWELASAIIESAEEGAR